MTTECTIVQNMSYNLYRSKSLFYFIGLAVTMAPTVVGMTAGVFILTELCCYLWIFHHLYKHNRAMILIMSAADVRKRLRGNVVQLSGHVLKFVMKVVWFYTTVFAVILSERNYLTLQLVSWVLMYGMNGLFQVMTSPSLRLDIVSYFDHFLARYGQPMKRKRDNKPGNRNPLEIRPQQ